MNRVWKGAIQAERSTGAKTLRRGTEETRSWRRMGRSQVGEEAQRHWGGGNT